MRTETRGGILPRFFGVVVERRGTVIAFGLVLLILGTLVFAQLPRDLFPNLALPSVQVLMQGPGRAPAELELILAQPLEQALLGMPGVRRVQSTIQAGVVQIVVVFDEAAGRDTWRHRQLVAERLAAFSLPEGISPPLISSAAGRLQEVQELVIEGPTIDPMVLRDVATRIVVPRLQAVPGVARIEMLGGEERQLQIVCSPEKMRLAGVSLDQIVEALDGTERDATAGALEVRDKLWFVSLATATATPDQVRRLPVHTAHGLLSLGDIAEIREAPAARFGLARFQGFEAVSLRVVKQPAAATLDTTTRVRAAVEQLQRTLPPGISLMVFYDQADLVRHALDGVLTALAIGAFFVALVLWTLLGNRRGALIVLTILPLAMLGASLPLTFLGLGLNAMTLGGLAIAVGLLVDAAIIMVENLLHRSADADPNGPRLAVLAAAAAEVARPLTASVTIILVVFLPLLALGGVAGRLFAPLAWTVASALAISLVASLTLVPALFARFGGPLGQKPGREIVLPGLLRIYRPALDFALRRRVLVGIAAIVLVVFSVWVGMGLGADFLPALDEGALMLQSLLPSDLSLVAVDQANRQLEEGLEGVAGVRGVYRRTGRGDVTEDPMPHSLSDVLVLLEPTADRARVGADLDELADHLPYSVEVTTPMKMRIAESIGGTPADIQVQLFAPDLDAVEAGRAEIQRLLSEVPGVATVAPDTGTPLLQWEIVPDDDALRRLDVPRHRLLQTAQAALQGIELEPRFEGVQQIDRVLRFPSDGRLTAESMQRLPLVVEEGRIVELGQVVSLREVPTASMLRRANGQRRLAFNIRVEGDLESVGRQVEQALAKAPLPAGTTFVLTGTLEEARETRRRLLAASGAALLLVLVLLYFSLGNWREVGIVVLTLPVALAGGVLALAASGGTWNASSIVGLIGLFGVAVQNSLVLITQGNDLRRQMALGYSEGMRQAALGRLRPKLLTALSSMLGLAPMLFGLAGSELEKPLAVVMVGGLLTSTLFTLLVLPAIATAGQDDEEDTVQVAGT